MSPSDCISEHLASFSNDPCLLARQKTGDCNKKPSQSKAGQPPACLRGGQGKVLVWSGSVVMALAQGPGPRFQGTGSRLLCTRTAI